MSKLRQNAATEEAGEIENDSLLDELAALNQSFEDCRQRFGWGSAMKRVMQVIMEKHRIVPDQGEKTDFHEELNEALAGLNQNAEKFGVRYDWKISDVNDISKKYEAREAEFCMNADNVERFSGTVSKLIEEIEAEKDRSRRLKTVKLLDDFIKPLLDSLFKIDDPKKLELNNINVLALNNLVKIGANYNDFLWKISSLVPAVFEELDPREASLALMSFFDFEKNLAFKIKRIPRGDTQIKHLKEADAGLRSWLSGTEPSLGSANFAVYVQRMKESYIKALEALIRQHEEWESKKDIITYFPEKHREALAFAKERVKDLKYRDRN